MASTFTTRLRLEKQATGENANTWGDKTNTNFDLIDESINESINEAIDDAIPVGLDDILDDIRNNEKVGASIDGINPEAKKKPEANKKPKRYPPVGPIKYGSPPP